MVLTKFDAVYERIRKSAQIVSDKGLKHLCFEAMATRCKVSVAGASDRMVADFSERLIHWISAFEAKYSRFIPESLIGEINRNAGIDWVEIDRETERIFNLCSEFHFLTKGVFDPSALPLIRLWNWKSKTPLVPRDAEIIQARELVGWNKIQRRSGGIFLPRTGMSIDLGGMGKEYAVDVTAELALQADISNALIDFGQDVRVIGLPPNKPAWHIGLENPASPGECWAGIAANDCAIASSGDYLRYFHHHGHRYGHILDVRTGYPVDNSNRGVTVMAPSCTSAGILATASFVLGPPEGLDLVESVFGAEGSIITTSNQYQTRRFNDYVVSSA